MRGVKIFKRIIFLNKARIKTEIGDWCMIEDVVSNLIRRQKKVNVFKVTFASI